MTEEALKVWRSLPDMIRVDPSLAIIRQEHEKLHGKCRFLFLKEIPILWPFCCDAVVREVRN